MNQNVNEHESSMIQNDYFLGDENLQDLGLYDFGMNFDGFDIADGPAMEPVHTNSGAQPYLPATATTNDAQLETLLASVSNYGINQPQEFQLMQPAQQWVQQQPQQQQEPTYPSDDYHPQIGWWKPALPGTADASWNRTIGWYTVVASTTSQKPPSSAAPSSTATPISGPAVSHSEMLQIPQVPQLFMPQPLVPPNANSVQDYDGQKRKRKQHQVTTTHPLEDLPAAASVPAKKVSIKQACVCTQRSCAHIPRPRNAFILYRSANAREFQRLLKSKNNQDVSRLAGEKWANETPEEKAHYQLLAKQEKEKHAMLYPFYRYTPASKNQSRFGDASCECGAYEANMEHERQNGGTVDVSELEPDREHRPARRAKRSKPQPVDKDEDDLPQQVPETFGIPVSQQASAQEQWTAQKTQKRKRSARKEDEPVLRRSNRSNGSVVSYADPDTDLEENIVVSQRPSGLTLPTKASKARPAPIRTSFAEPSQQLVQKSSPTPPAHFPAMNTRRAFSSKASQLSTHSSLFGEFLSLSPHSSPAKKGSAGSAKSQSSPWRRNVRLGSVGK